jgi:hypothetical protein
MPRRASQDVDDAVLAQAALFDCGCLSDMDWDDEFEEDEDYNQLERLRIELEDADKKLSAEVQVLQDSVKAMAQDVARATDKINELRDLVSRYMEQRVSRSD